MLETRDRSISRTAFGVLWRLAILSLPWQTRWFADASLGGWPWEQGRWSVYASWALMFVVIALGTVKWRTLFERRNCSSTSTDRPNRAVGSPSSFEAEKIVRHFILPVLIILTLFTTLSRIATTQWWIEVLLLAAFYVTLRRAGVSASGLMAWSSVSLIPHAVLAIWQYFTGAVIASKWLGIAGHLASELGVSVVQHGDFRVLRAYGGFPHPNILGAWMAVGLVLTLILASRSSANWRALAWSAASALFSASLVVSYARGAWIGAVLGIIAWMVLLLRSKRSDAAARQFGLIALFAAVAVGGAVVVSQRQHVFARADLGERLEAQSVVARGKSLGDGWSVFRARPLFGAGPNAELVPLASSCGARCPEPLEPPHDVPLLALADLGIIGLLIGMAFIWSLRPRIPIVALPCILTILPIALVDHLLWSTWSGLCLSALVCAYSVWPPLDKDAENA